MLHGRAKAWQGFSMLASWSHVFGDEGELRRLGRLLKEGSLPRLRKWLQAGEFQENRRFLKLPR